MTTLGIVGAGQLGWMLGLAARELGLDVAYLDPNPESPGRSVGPLTVAAFDDAAALRDFAAACDRVTYEVESVPVESVRLLAELVDVDPAPDVLEDAQDRLREKRLFERLGIPCAPYAPADGPDAVVAAGTTLGWPVVVKSRAAGFDGRGQRFCDGPDDVPTAWDELGASEVVVEAVVPFDREVSIIACRGRDGDVVAWPLVENHHRDGILRLSIAPAPATSPALQQQAEAYARAVLELFDYVGVVTIEMFQVGERLVANEIAPRVHNSGHWTIEGSATSQFTNHVRAVCDLPLGATDTEGDAAMINMIGEPFGPESVERIAAHDWSVLHDYGKAPRPGRKIGHLTITAADRTQLEDRLARFEDLLPSGW